MIFILLLSVRIGSAGVSNDVYSFYPGEYPGSRILRKKRRIRLYFADLQRPKNSADSLPYYCFVCFWIKIDLRERNENRSKTDIL